MIRMLGIPAILLGLSVFYGQAFAEPTGIEAKLKADFVTAKNEKFTIDRFRVCQLVRPAELGGGASEVFQVKSHAEAPVDVISRDNFVALLAEVGVNLRVSFARGHIKGMTPQQALTSLRCKVIAAQSGPIDFDVDIRMDNDGMQLAVTDTATGQVDKQTQQWAQVFGQ